MRNYHRPGYMQEWRKQRRDHVREYRAAHKSRDAAAAKIWRASHKDNVKAARKRYIVSHPEYRTVTDMKTRCRNPNAVNYMRYGGRGIRCLIRSAAELIAAIGPKPGPGYSVDRIDNSGHYEATNIRWATASEQAHNRGKANRG